MHSVKVDGQDVEAVHKAAKRALEYARSGKGPVYLVAETYRLVGHFVGDAQVYRPKGEQEELRETQDPITKLREKLGLADDEWEAMDSEALRDRGGVGAVREERHRPEARGRAQERLCLS